MYYPEEVIEEVRTRNDIVDIISGYVKLQKKGSNYFGLCPFHHEKSPSFSVSQSKQMYHCFGCGVSGNVFTFVMEYENYTFREAVELLADRSGVKLPKMEYSKEAKAQADLRAALLEINKMAANYFYYQLKQPQGQQGPHCRRQRPPCHVPVDQRLAYQPPEGGEPLVLLSHVSPPARAPGPLFLIFLVPAAPFSSLLPSCIMEPGPAGPERG